MSLRLGLLSILVILMVPMAVNAQAKLFNQKYTKLGFHQLQFSGENGESFTDDATAFGLEASQVLTNRWLGFESKVRGGLLSGSQDFDNEGVEEEADYSFYYGEFLAGVRLYFVPQGDTTFSAHVGAGGIVGFHYLNLTPNNEESTLPGSTSATSFGYEVNCGGELRFGNRMGSKYILYADVAVRNLKSKLAGKTNFSTNGLYVSVGIGW